VIDEPLNLLRMANVALTLAAGGGLFVRGNDDWARLTHGWRTTLAFLVATFLVLSYGSVEALYQEAPVGARTVALTVVSLGVVVGLVLARRDVTTPGARVVEASRVLDAVARADNGEFGEPCTHPGCVAARNELRRLLLREHPVDHGPLAS
jgi:hypothetical protein